MSWRLNHRRREAFLGTLREAGLRSNLEMTLQEIRTLRGYLCSGRPFPENGAG
jgi:hypothetical protein